MEGAKEALSRKVAAEIVLSSKPGKTMRKWRGIFGIAQKDLAMEMRVSPSVLSDYESGRRRSPGAFTIKRFVDALIRVDERRGGEVMKSMARGIGVGVETVVDVRDFSVPIKISELVDALDGKVVACRELLGESIYGYTIIDSKKAILSLSGYEFIRLMGMTTERALIFTGVSTGRSPMIAIRVQTLKPRAVVLQGPVASRDVDSLSVELADREKIPLIVTKRDVDGVRNALSDLMKK